MSKRLVCAVGLALLCGCGSGPEEPLSVVSIRTDRQTYADTGIGVVTVRLLAGMPVWVYGCYGRPAFEVDDSTGFPATGAACPLGTADVHPIRLGPGDSLVTSFGLYTLTGGMYRAQVMYGVNQGGCCVVAEAKFVVQ